MGKRPSKLQEWSMKCNEDGTYKSSVDKFYDQDDLSAWAKTTGAKAGDMILFYLSCR
jgi:aspartyl-tRNA synthetase